MRWRSFPRSSAARTGVSRTSRSNVSSRLEDSRSHRLRQLGDVLLEADAAAQVLVEHDVEPLAQVLAHDGDIGLGHPGEVGVDDPPREAPDRWSGRTTGASVRRAWSRVQRSGSPAELEQRLAPGRAGRPSRRTGRRRSARRRGGSRGFGTLERRHDRIDADPLVAQPPQAPTPPRARRSWRDRRAVRHEGLDRARLVPAGPGRRPPPRGRAARDGRATARSPLRTEAGRTRARPRGFPGRRACGPASPSRGSRAGPSSRLPHPRRGLPAPRKRLGQRHHGVPRLAHRRAEVLVRRGLEPAAEVLLLRQQVAQAPWRRPDGRAAGRSGAASRRAGRSCRRRSGPGPVSTSCQPPSAFWSASRAPVSRLILLANRAWSISHQA